MMNDTRVMSIDELNAFLSSSDVLTFKGNLRVETCGWIGHILRTYSYFSPPRSEKGLIQSYMQKITGNSSDIDLISGCFLGTMVYVPGFHESNARPQQRLSLLQHKKLNCVCDTKTENRNDQRSMFMPEQACNPI